MEKGIIRFEKQSPKDEKIQWDPTVNKSESDEWISKKIKYLMENEGMKQDQAIAVAYSMAGKARKSLEKAEGARGGHIIGHTKSGKPIYENSDHHINEKHKVFQGEKGKWLRNRIDLGGGKTKVHTSSGGKGWTVSDGDDDGPSHFIPHDAIIHSDDMKKSQGEGAKGGHVVGHTRTGKPIYESPDHPGHKDFTAKEHYDAAAHHHTMGEILNNDPEENERGGVHIQMARQKGGKPEDRDHYLSARDHYKFHLTSKPKYRPAETALRRSQEGNCDMKKSIMNLLDELKKAIPEAGVNIEEKVKLTPEEEAEAKKKEKDKEEKSCASMPMNVKKSEGSRGGKIIGHTKSGKPIYEDHTHPSHSEFTPGEHREGQAIHTQRMNDAEKNKKDSIIEALSQHGWKNGEYGNSEHWPEETKNKIKGHHDEWSKHYDGAVAHRDARVPKGKEIPLDDVSKSQSSNFVEDPFDAYSGRMKMSNPTYAETGTEIDDYLEKSEQEHVPNKGEFLPDTLRK